MDTLAWFGDKVVDALLTQLPPDFGTEGLIKLAGGVCFSNWAFSSSRIRVSCWLILIRF
jgi:hypothetical protein